MRYICRAFLQLLLLVRGFCVVVQKVSVSEPVLAGHKAKLECLWSEGSGPPLYSLRWCKDGHQFFSITLRPELRKISFPMEGVQVLLSSSNERYVSLTNVSASTAGQYTCETMSDRPQFLSSAKSLILKVVEIPASGPSWHGLLSVYHVEQSLRAHCHVGGSNPPADFSFYINDHLIEEDTWIIRHKPVRETQSSNWNSSSTLVIPLSSRNVKRFLEREEIELDGERNAIRYEEGRGSFQPLISTVQTRTGPTERGRFRQLLSTVLNRTGSIEDGNRRVTLSSPPPSSSPPHSSTPFRVPSTSSVSSGGSRGLSYSPLVPSSVPDPLYHRKLNLTCLANIGGVQLFTSAKSTVALQKEPYSNSIRVLLQGKGGKVISQSVFSTLLIATSVAFFQANL